MSLFPVNDCYRVRTVTITMCAEKTLLSLLRDSASVCCDRHTSIIIVLQCMLSFSLDISLC